MGDLAKYIAEVVEFVVAGVLVFFSLLLLGYVVVRPDLAELPDELPFLSSLGGLLPVVGIALIYALGILAEGISRIMFEHGLGELTAKELQDKDSPKQQAEHAEKLAEVARLGRSDAATKDAVHDATVKHFEGVREEWRMYVLANSPSLTAQVDGQLKRLRIERAAALSGGIGSLALTIDVTRTAVDEGATARGVALALLILATAVSARLWLVWKELPSRSEVQGSAVVKTTQAALDNSEAQAASSDERSDSDAADADGDAADSPSADSGAADSPSAGVSDGSPKRDRATWKVARAATVVGSAAILTVLVSLVQQAGTDVMGLRAALLVATLAVTACAVVLSLVRLKRYLSSIVRCYRALTDQPAVVTQLQDKAALP